MSDIKDHTLKNVIEGLWIHGRNKDARRLEKVDANLSALKEENERLWEILLKVGIYLEIDPEWARKQPGKPSDVFIGKISAIKARVAELEAVEPITAVLAYRNKGYRGVCGATVGADGQGFYAVVYRGLSFDSASNHARNLMRELEASKYQIGECLFVDASETISGNPISVVTKEPANEG